jgi:hypothetical protein
MAEITVLMNQLAEYIQYPKSLERLGVCSSCPSLIKETLTCQQCGCNMKLKVLVPLTTCPLGKW